MKRQVPMKRLIPLLVPAVVLAGCSAATTPATTTLVPLNPDQPKATVVITSPGTTMYPAEQFAFFDDVVFYNNGPTNLTNEDILWYGELWCQLMEEGMGDTDVVERINEGAIDEFDRRQHFAIVLAGISNLCPSQGNKAEYIALNQPLP